MWNFRGFSRSAPALTHTAIVCALLLFLSACSEKKRENSAGGNGMALTLENNEQESLMWGDAESLKGNKASPRITGTCGKSVAEIQVVSSGGASFKVPCTKGAFTLNFDSVPFTNPGSPFGIAFTPITKKGTEGTTVSRMYDFRYVDLTAALSVSPQPPTSTTATSFSFGGTCDPTLDIQVQFNSETPFACPGSGNWGAINASLEMGPNAFTITWYDSYGNNSASNYSVSRVPPPAALVIAGGISATPTGLIVANEGSSNRARLHYTADIVLGVGNSPGVPMAVVSVPAGRGQIAPGNLSVVYSP